MRCRKLQLAHKMGESLGLWITLAKEFWVQILVGVDTYRREPEWGIEEICKQRGLNLGVGLRDTNRINAAVDKLAGRVT